MNRTDSSGYAAQQVNKRLAARRPMIVEKIPCDDGHKTFFGYAKNISRGGLFVATVNPREPSEEFTIQLTLPTNPAHTLRCRCEVVWKRQFRRRDINEPGMGLRFLDLSDADADKIDEWVSVQTLKGAE